MLYIIVNRTRTDLSQEDYQRLAELARDFYANVPQGMRILNDWAATDGSCTFALIEAQDPALIDQVQAPFAPYVDMERVEVTPISGWRDPA